MNATVATITGSFAILAIIVTHVLARRDRNELKATVNTIEVNTNQRLSDALREIRDLKEALLGSQNRSAQLTSTIESSDKEVPETTRETGA